MGSPPALRVQGQPHGCHVPMRLVHADKGCKGAKTIILCMGAMLTCTVHAPLGARQVETGLVETQGGK